MAFSALSRPDCFIQPVLSKQLRVRNLNASAPVFLVRSPPNLINPCTTHTSGMKYTARHIQRFLDTGRIDATLWKNHFPTLLPTQVPTCEECGEFKDRTCAGGRDPVDCFLGKPSAEEPSAEQKKKKRDPILGLGAKGKYLHGTAKPKDQSKM
jgi:hypothetical protein